MLAITVLSHMIDNVINKLRFKRKTIEGKLLPNPTATELEVNNWRVSEVVLKHLVPVVGIHPFPLNELMMQAGTVVWLEPKYIFEWGTHIGKSARVFFEATKAFNIETQIHSIDLPDDVSHAEHPHNDRGKLVRGLPDVYLHQGDGLATALGILAKLGTEDEKSGGKALFFVDGDHSYESVKRELSGIMKSAPGAAILLHDTFYQSEDSNYNIGPYQAINECLAASTSKFKRIDTSFGLPGMTLLYPATT
ncbi:MAG: class I SAM-dependent methyltransferase [Candidatus Saccharimonadia bacterium]